MLRTIREAFGTTYHSGPKPQPIPHVRRDHPTLEFLLDAQSAIILCKEGSQYVSRDLLTEKDRDLLKTVEPGFLWHSDGLEGMVNSMILVLEGADLIAGQLERMSSGALPPRVRRALDRFVAKLPAPMP